MTNLGGVTVEKRMVRRVAAMAATLMCLALPLIGTTPAEAATQATIKVDFGPVGQKVPSGYHSDTGGAYSASTGRGWISQTTSSPLSIVGNGRDRNKVADARLDTLIAMQYTGSSGVAKPARWEAAVQNGIYDVTVAVGDVAATSGSKHRITVEKTTVIDNFVPSAKNRTATVTARVQVTDGKVTLDAAGGTNTILDYVTIVPVTGVLGAGATLARINFAPTGVATPYGYVNDSGSAYSDARGYGWISQSSSTPLSIVGNSRDRDATNQADQRLDTFTCMQYAGSGGVNQPARWQYKVPNGTYDVTVSVGDASYAAGSTHRVSVNGVVAVNNFVPTSTTLFKQAKVRVTVTDGFIVLDAAGGTNTKINFVDIVDADNTPRTITGVVPASGSTAAAVDAPITLTASHAVDPTSATSATVALTGPGSAPIAGTVGAAGNQVTFTPSAELDPTTQYTVQTTTGLRDASGNPFAAFSASFTTGTPTPVQYARINFQPQTAAVPAGYSKDYGQAYDTARGFGWVQPGTQTPVSLVGLARIRNVNDDARLDTFVHMQNATPGDWQVAAPNGTYDVTVAVGDANGLTDSTHLVKAEGTTVVGPFTPTSADRFRTATVRVKVTDGFLTLSATGGTNTKIDYVTVDHLTASGATDTWNPKVELTTAGPGTSPTFNGPVTVTADTTDLGTGIASTTSVVDGGAPKAYTGPITVSSAGSHTVVVTTTDGAGNTGTAQSTFSIQAPPGSPAITVSDQEDVLGLTSRLLFSTAQHAATPARSFTITNPGGSDLVVSGMTIAGTDPGQFSLDPSQPTSFTVPAGQTAAVSALFVPKTLGVKRATLTIASNDPLSPNYVVALRGVDAGGTAGDTEPTMTDLMNVFGYSTNTGITDVFQATTRAPVGDEVIAPYFTRVDSTKPVSMVPIARYVAATSFTSDTGYAPTKYSGARTTLYKFPADTLDDNPDDGVDTTQFAENQKVMPNIAPGGTTTFNPNAAFGITGNYANYSDDQFNRGDDGTVYHNVRVWPAKGPGGVQLPNAWLIGVDVNFTTDKNFDYQDQVMLLTNATPDLTPAAAPGSASTNLDFSSPVSGTVADKDGQGTGFASVQANTAGTQYKPGLIDLTGGTLQITSTAGKSSGNGAKANDQDNALQVHVDASRSDISVEGRILNPASDLTAGYQQKAVWFGPDQNNYLKLEIEHRIDTPGIFLTAFLEVNGSTSTIGQSQILDPASVSTLDFQIAGDLETGTLQGGYRINSSAEYTPLGTPFQPPNIFQWFSPQARAGVLVSHTGATTAITGVFDWFRVL
ncbi:MAG: Ig-like domain-containing protein [Acidimicrobiia bacterium]|nr:Ig-like domain-containing protein [Acidimicrobiia bacterium]